MALPIMIDCDPGHDDAIALVLALASPELEVKAVTASAGNQTPEKTLRNVLRMLTLLNRPDIPVAGGAWKPLMRDLIIADNVHAVHPLHRGSGLGQARAGQQVGGHHGGEPVRRGMAVRFAGASGGCGAVLKYSFGFEVLKSLWAFQDLFFS